MEDSKKIVESYLKLKDWRVKENSNRPFSYGALNSYISGEVAKDYWLREVYPQYIADAYVDGHIHIHDLGCLSLYCCGYSLKEILKKGVRGVQNIPTSGPAKHFDSVLNQIANLVTVYQNEIAGAVAFNSFDTLLAPFIKVDGLNYEQVVQNMQNFIYSVNSNSRAGAEPAFSNITFDLTPPEDLLDQKAIIGGKKVDFTYRECQKEMDMLNRAFCEIMLAGDAEGKLFAYPIPTYNIHKRFDWDNPNNDLLWEMAGKFGLPYFANFINSDMEIGDVRSMAFLGTQRVVYKDKYGTVAINELRHLVDNWIQADEGHKPHYEILMDGNFINCSEMFKIDYSSYSTYNEIVLENGYVNPFSYQHKCLILRDGKQQVVESQDVKVGDKFLISTKPWGVNNNIGTYQSGKMLGYYIAEGWKAHENELNFAININREDIVQEITKYFEDMGCRVRVDKQEDKNIFKVFVYGSAACGFIKQFVRGEKAIEKRLNGFVWGASDEFRKGIYDGYYETDGSISCKNFAHTTNKELCEDLITLASSIGKIFKYSINNNNTRYFDNKEDKEYFTSYKLDVVEYPQQDGFYVINVKENHSRKAGNIEYVYNFTVDSPEHLVELPNGVITHQCCRLRLDLRELRKKNGGLFGAGDATGSIGVVTINLPRLGYEHKGDREGFFKALRHYLDIAKDSLEIKRKWLQENILDTNAIPAFMEYVGTMNNHFSVIGEVGANEMCENFMGKNILDPEAHAFVHEVHEFILDALKDYQEETGNLYAFEATPAEGTCYRFAMKDKSIYTDIITQGNGGDPYYTNSCHIPVKYIKSIDKTFKHQEDLQVQFNSGTVIHIYLEGGIMGEQAKSIIYNVCHNYKVPYVSLSPISRYCEEHGYIKENVDECPICGARLKKYQRITGYLRCVDNFNNGKAAEFRDRKQIKI